MDNKEQLTQVVPISLSKEEIGLLRNLLKTETFQQITDLYMGYPEELGVPQAITKIMFSFEGYRTIDDSLQMLLNDTNPDGPEIAVDQQYVKVFLMLCTSTATELPLHPSVQSVFDKIGENLTNKLRSIIPPGVYVPKSFAIPKNGKTKEIETPIPFNIFTTKVVA